MSERVVDMVIEVVERVKSGGLAIFGYEARHAWLCRRAYLLGLDVADVTPHALEAILRADDDDVNINEQTFWRSAWGTVMRAVDVEIRRRRNEAQQRSAATAGHLDKIVKSAGAVGGAMAAVRILMGERKK